MKLDFNKIIVACGTPVQRYVTPEQIRQIFGREPSKDSKEYPFPGLNTSFTTVLTRNGEEGEWFRKLFDCDMQNSKSKALNELPTREIHRVINSPAITDGNLLVPEAYIYEPVEGLAELLTKYLDGFEPYPFDSNCSIEARINAILLLKAASLKYYSDGNIIVRKPQIGLVDFEESTLRNPESEPIRDLVNGYKLLKEELGPEEITVDMLLGRCNESLEILSNRDIQNTLRKHLEVAMRIDESEAGLIIKNTIRAIEKFRDDLKNGTAF